ncbi:MAG TPA: nickel pincer cofactor biosynthesis protein LarC [Dehalococcoidia bacterium]|nr:nickel pincer cofactor biosynthesis protein LarC [Dehalococcoidia bacterium]
MPRIAYFDCFSGASGDMVLGALVDAGLPFSDLCDEVAKLPLPAEAYRLTASRVQRAGFAATKVDVEVRERPRHRSLAEVLGMISASTLPQADRESAARIFRALGEAEAKVHGTPVEEVELHEVGAVDAMVDVVGAVAGLRLLGVEAVYVSALPLGHGEARASHGAFPVPAPATLELLAAAGAPLSAGEGPAGELVTPTGAAILSVLGRFERPAMRLRAVGYGAGGRDPAGRPNVLRLWLGDAEAAPRTMRLVETNIDDMTPELFGYVQERLFAAGAADVWFTAIQMKKNRPGVLLSVLCSEALESEVIRIILAETTTLGLRSQEVRRYEAEREPLEFESSLGPAAVKVKRLPGEPPRVAPEYEACRRLAEASGLPLAEVYRRVTAEALERLAGGPSAS